MLGKETLYFFGQFEIRERSHWLFVMHYRQLLITILRMAVRFHRLIPIILACLVWAIGMFPVFGKDAFDVTAKQIDRKNLRPLGPEYAWETVTWGFYLDGHGLPNHYGTFVVVRVPNQPKSKRELIWPAFAYGYESPNAAVLDGRIVFTAAMPDHTPVLMAHKPGSPPMVISPAVLRLAARRLGRTIVVPEKDYYFSQVRLPPGRIWLKASTMPSKSYSGDTAFIVELTSADLDHVIDETVEQGRPLKAKTFNYIAEDAYFTRLNRQSYPTDAPTAPNPSLRVENAYVPEDERLYGNGLVDVVNRFAYFSTVHEPGRILKVSPGDQQTDPPRVVGAVVMEPEENDCFYGTIESAGGYAYYNAKYGRLVKIALGKGDAAPKRIGSLLLAKNDSVGPGVADSGAGYGCFSGRGKIFKIKLGKGDEMSSLISTLELPDRAEEIVSAVLDPSTHEVLLGSEYNMIYKLDLGTNESPPRIIGTIELPRDQGGFRGALLDPRKRCCCFISHFGFVIKISIGDKNQPPKLLGVMQVPNSFRYLEHTFGSDNSGYGYLGADGSGDSQAAILKIDPGNESAALPRIVATLPLKPGEDYIAGGVTAPWQDALCLGIGTGPCTLQKLSLGKAEKSPTIVSKTKLLAYPYGEHQ